MVGVLDEQQRSTIFSLVQEEVDRLTQSARLTTWRTSVRLTIGNRMVNWAIHPDSSLRVIHEQTVSLAVLSTLAPTDI
jgi:hypothetical protein